MGLRHKAAKKQLCLRTGIELERRALRCSPWRTFESLQEVEVESSGADILTGKFLILRCGGADCLF